MFSPLMRRACHPNSLGRRDHDELALLFGSDCSFGGGVL